MPSWTSPWPVAATLESHLKSAGIDRATEPVEALPNDALVLYAPPDALLIAALGQSNLPPSPEDLMAGYGRLQSLRGRFNLIAAWRLQALDPQAIRQWLRDGTPIQGTCPFPSPDPLTALLTRSLLESQPQLLGAYLDLELTSQLAGGEPDTRYLQRLDALAADSAGLLRGWWLPLQERQAVLEDNLQLDARAKALAAENRTVQEQGETTLRFLHQTQEELERIALVDREKEVRIGELQQRVEAQAARLAELDGSLARLTSEREGVARERDAALRHVDAVLREKEDTLIALRDLNDQLAGQSEALRSLQEDEARHAARAADLERQKQQTSEEAERLLKLLCQTQAELERCTLLDQGKDARLEDLQRTTEKLNTQLTSLQEELENQFLTCRASAQLIAAQDGQLKRAQSLMSRLLAQVIRGDHSAPAIAVEVIAPPLAGSEPRSLPGGRSSKDRQGWSMGRIKRAPRE